MVCMSVGGRRADRCTERDSSVSGRMARLQYKREPSSKAAEQLVEVCVLCWEKSCLVVLLFSPILLNVTQKHIGFDDAAPNLSDLCTQNTLL